MPLSTLVLMSLCSRCSTRAYRDGGDPDTLPDDWCAVDLAVYPDAGVSVRTLCPVCSDALADWLRPTHATVEPTPTATGTAASTPPTPTETAKPATADREEVKAQLQAAIDEALADGATADDLHALTPDTGSPKTWKHATPKLEEMLAAVRALVETMRQPADDAPPAPADDAPDPVDLAHMVSRVTLLDSRLNAADSIAIRQTVGVGVATKPGDVPPEVLEAWAKALEALDAEPPF